MAFLPLLLSLLLAGQSASLLQRFHSADRFGRTRVIAEVMTGAIDATPDEARELLSAALKDGESDVRRQAVGSIGAILVFEPMPFLPANQQHRLKYLAVAKALVPEVNAALKDEDARVRADAIRALYAPLTYTMPRGLLPLEVVQRLAALFDDPAATVRSLVISSLRLTCLSSEPAVVAVLEPMLLRALADVDPAVVQHAGGCVSEARYPKALPLLIRQVTTNPSAVARMGAALGLQGYVTSARPYLRELEEALAKEPPGPARSTLDAAITRIRRGRD